MMQFFLAQAVPPTLTVPWHGWMERALGRLHIGVVPLMHTLTSRVNPVWQG